MTLPEIEAVLNVVKEGARHPFIYPMFVFAAHTGARRSEILRSKLTDLDFESGLLTIHERKKSHDKRTTRQIPMSPLLREALQEWLKVHPGGTHTFAVGMTVSAGRWLIIDTIHACTGLPRPAWNDATLPDKLAAFEALVDAHFRHYQFYANTAVAIAFSYVVAVLTDTLPAGDRRVWLAMFVGLELLFLVTSRDTLRNYYRRATRLLGPPDIERRCAMANGRGHGKPPKTTKPSEKPRKPANVRK